MCEDTCGESEGDVRILVGRVEGCEDTCGESELV